MPPKKKTDETVEPEGPNAAQAAAAEAGVIEPADVPDGMVAVPFRGVDVLIPKPSNKGRAAFLYRQAMANYDIDKMLAVIVGDAGTAQIATLVTDDDDPSEVIVDFFKAMGQATGSGNS
jgi:hypothetical protein